MTIKELIAIANEEYPDGHLIIALESEDPHDGLAEFIVNEIGESFDETSSDEEQLIEALHSMEIASGEISGVIAALQTTLFKILNEQNKPKE